MPRVFVYEHICALGVGRDPASPEHSLYVEGRAMRTVITADFAAVPGVEVISFPDDFAAAPGVEVVSFPDGGDFSRLAASADWTLVIAPETRGVLIALTARVTSVGGKLLGPSPMAVAIGSNKTATEAVWHSAGIPKPKRFSTVKEITFPVVCKPRDGCGSDGVNLIRTADALVALSPDPHRLVQEYVPGQPASVAFLIGPKQTIPLLPTFQHLSTDGRFRYLGGEGPIPPELAERAVRLGLQAIGCMPGLFGYVGVDLVLGERDVAIEINPRLTTSYVGLRALAETNLAGAMLDVCEGKQVDVKWNAGGVRWSAGGTVGWPTLSESRS